jgi:hypothetical protein
MGVGSGRRRQTPAGCGDGRDVVVPPRRRQVEPVARPLVRRPASSRRYTRAGRSQLANYPARIFDTIGSAGKRRERGPHLALHLETNDVVSRCRRAAVEGIALRQGERTSPDHDRTWEHEAAQIAYPDALAAIVRSKAGRTGTGPDGEGGGSNRRIADRQAVHSITCNGEIRGHALHRCQIDFDAAAGLLIRYDEVRRSGAHRALI